MSGQRPPGDTIEANFPIGWCSRRRPTLLRRAIRDGARLPGRDRSHIRQRVDGDLGATRRLQRRGLLGIAISPTFTEDHFVFAFYSSSDRHHQYVMRWTDCGGVGINPVNIIELPAGGDCCHKGGRARLRPRRQALRHPWRGTHGQRRPEHFRRAGKDLALQPRRQHPRRQSLRFQQSGAGRSGSRNPFGIAFSATGQLAVTNNGPTGDAGSPTTGFDTLVLSVARGQGLSVAELLRLQPSPRKPNVRNRTGRPRLEQRDHDRRPHRRGVRRRLRASWNGRSSRVLHPQQRYGDRDARQPQRRRDARAVDLPTRREAGTRPRGRTSPMSHTSTGLAD